MSLREQIAQELVRIFKEIEDPRVVLVTREPYEADKLAITQFPAMLVQVAKEDRETITMGAPSVGRRMGTITVNLRCHVRGTELDRKRNDLIEGIEEQIEKDRYLNLRSSGVLDCQVAYIEVIERLAPLAEILIELRIRYNYARATT
jgi:hypothetical protein